MIEARLFDGSSARAHPVRLRVEGAELVAEGEALRRWPLHAVRWPETTRHGQRVLHLADGLTIEIIDARAFDEWRRRQRLGESPVVHWQQSWRGVAVAAAALVALLWAMLVHGVPGLARGVVALVPVSVDQAVGQQALQALSDRLLEPSALPGMRQVALRQRLEAAATAGLQGRERPEFRILFRSGHKALGANAFALPGGTIVITDALVELVADREDALIGVFGHELGHVRRRHGMRAVVQVSLVGVVASVVLGDFSTVLAGVPALLGQLAYSRDAEREADADALALLRRNGHGGDSMVVLFERLRPQAGRGGALPIAFSSHPLDEERIAFFTGRAR